MIGGEPESVSNIRSFINKHNWEEIKHLSGKNDWGKFEKNNFNVTLNVLYVKEMRICPAYISKYESSRKEQITLLMILAAKMLPAMLRGITSKNNSDFFCLICPHSFRTENKFEFHSKIC